MRYEPKAKLHEIVKSNPDLVEWLLSGNPIYHVDELLALVANYPCYAPPTLDVTPEAVTDLYTWLIAVHGFCSSFEHPLVYHLTEVGHKVLSMTQEELKAISELIETNRQVVDDAREHWLNSITAAQTAFWDGLNVILKGEK